MKFINEQTYENYIKKNQESLFHKKFDDAVQSLKKGFGNIDYPIIIDNKKIYTKDKYKHISPIDRRIVIGYVSKVTEELINRAIESSFQSFKVWSKYDYHDRIKILKKAANTMRKRKFELAALLTFENGKNRYEAVADIDEAIDFINYYCMDMIDNNGYITINKSKGDFEKNISVMKPYGVWGIISPFNFPAAIFLGMSIGAIITGNTAVVKPASNTPIIGYKLVEIIIDSGLPPGILNYITGDSATIGKIIINSKKISGIVFTGSKDVGYTIFKDSSTIKPRPIIAELGGKNPTIVTQTANLDKAAEGVSKAAFSYGGQKCSACSRVYVQKDIKKEFIEKLISNVKQIRIENPENKDSDLGPLINSNAFQNFKKYVKIATEKGKVLYGGKVIEDGNLKYGYYVMPTIVNGLSFENTLFKKELFLPFLCIKEYDKFNEAISMCNNSEYGLTAGIYTNDKKELEDFINNIEAGVVYVNRKKSSTTGALVGKQSFGGWKSSGISGKGTGGKYYLTQFMREQSQTILQ
ncbi:MAG TPA: aldehyde dehydrogenase family protein [Nitrososphaeraceae archaeon]|nr:aldehyde dehydrogenase family protein [Nitrososphaeraceae archaeon]